MVFCVLIDLHAVTVFLYIVGALHVDNYALNVE